MYIDSQLMFSDEQAVTSTAISTNVVDLGPITDNTTRDVGAGEPIYLVVETAVTCTDLVSDATVTLTLESDDNVSLSSATTHFTSGSLAFATYATAGTRFVQVALPKGDYQRYLGVRYTVAVGPLTAGAFNAYLTKDPQNWKDYDNRY